MTPAPTKSPDSGTPGSEESGSGSGSGSEKEKTAACSTLAASVTESRPSVQVVRFHFPTTASRFVVDGGAYCDVVQIARIDPASAAATLVPQSAAFECGCECPRPFVGSTTALRLSGASTPTLEWDARGVSFYKCNDVCQGGGTIPDQTFDFTHHVTRPLAPGRYRATFAIFDSIPPQWSAQGPDHITADNRNGFGDSPPNGFGGGACEGARKASVDFDLPAAPTSLDIDVAVP
ncbi:MAG: hypothetical protein JWM74_2316 [Myxococcaceae bacterium]|nr:hypothetical protein [Myxococcaceae bacterium]